MKTRTMSLNKNRKVIIPFYCAVLCCAAVSCCATVSCAALLRRPFTPGIPRRDRSASTLLLSPVLCCCEEEDFCPRNIADTVCWSGKMAPIVILLCLLAILDNEKFSRHPEKSTGFRSVLPPAVDIPCKGSDVLHKQLLVALSQTFSSTNVCLSHLPAMMVLQDCFLSSNLTFEEFAGDFKADDNVCVSVKRKRCLFFLLLLLSGNVQLNPGPPSSSSSQIATPADFISRSGLGFIHLNVGELD